MKKEEKNLCTFISGCFILIFLFLVLVPLKTQAAVPTPPYFQLRVSPSAGADDTGDGGTGNPSDYNYYFVGQTFNAQIKIHTNNINTISANVIIHYDKDYLEVQDALPDPGIQITPGTVYETYPLSGNTVDTTNGIIRLTGYSASSVYNSGAGEGTFGTITFKVIQQKTTSQGDTGNPTFVDIEFLGVDVTTDSNINDESAQDIMADEEDSYWHLWPDTTKPYIDGLDPADGETNVSVTKNLIFHFKDDETGVDPSTLKIKVNGNDYTSYASFSCSGLWGTNDCTVTVDPPGTRNWDYFTEYEVELEDGKDKASPDQEPEGPNEMDEVEYEFTTQPDVWPPYARNHLPAKNATGVPVDTNVSFEIVDIEGGITGTGVNLSTVKIMVKGEEFCQSGCASGFESATPLTLDGFTYGYRITVDPAGEFEENEIVSVSIYNAKDQDTAPPAPTPNVMTVDSYIFNTTDTQAPYFTDHYPPKGAYFSPGSTNVSFHVKDDGRGVDIDTVSVQIGDATYTRTSPEFSYSGDSSDYYIEIEPGDFAVNKAVPIKLRASDIKASPANTAEEIYAIFYLEAPECPPCPPCSCGGCPSCPPCPEKGVCPPCKSCPFCEEKTCPPCPELICPEEGFCPPCPECPSCLAFPGIEEKIIKIPTGPVNISPPAFRSLKINGESIEMGGKIYIDKNWIVFEGKTLPESEVILEIYSDFLLLKTLSDAQGHWETKIKTNLLKEGEHSVFVRVIKGDQKSERVNLANVIIKPEALKEKVCLEEKILGWWQRLLLWQKTLILGGAVFIGFGVIKIILKIILRRRFI
jgi:hypothetical protein